MNKEAMSFARRLDHLVIKDKLSPILFIIMLIYPGIRTWSCHVE